MMHRFYISQKNISEKRVEITDSDQRHQILNVLRLRTGDQFEVFSDDCVERVVEIALMGKGGIIGHVIACRGGQLTAPTREIILYLGLLKKDKFEWVLQKGAEIGISRFVPLLTEHAIKQIKEIPPRWKKILKEAVEQCGGITIPEISEPIKFKDALLAISSTTMVAQARPLQLFFHPLVEENFSREILEEQSNEIAIWIGPEGGWGEEEIQLAKEANFSLVSFGERVFRAETAAIVIPSVVKFLS